MYNDLNPILHSQLRLAIISLLVKNKAMEFTEIRAATNATAGNLSVQIKKLEAAEYITVLKSFKNNYPLTTLKLTQKGLLAFEEYVNELKKYLEP
ncbi:MAG: transcriptional regulator [Salinivirgaceae bacterium]|nr:transcriptional regulator [Salinivirgaceae bacterium]